MIYTQHMYHISFQFKPDVRLVSVPPRIPHRHDALPSPNYAALDCEAQTLKNENNILCTTRILCV